MHFIRGVTVHLMGRRRQIARETKARPTSARTHQTGLVSTTWLDRCGNGAEMTGDCIQKTAGTVP